MKANSSTIGGAAWKMGSKTIVDVSQVEETIKNIPIDSFTVLDFIEAFRKVYPEDWGRLVESLGFSEAKEDTLWQPTFQTDSMYIHRKPTQFLFHS